MGRPARETPGGFVYHVLNRSVGRRRLFRKSSDYSAFERIIDETLRIRSMRIVAYSLMPNHWHLVLWPKGDGDLSAFMQQMTNKHVKRWKKHYGETGEGHLYQGRFKSFPVQTDQYFYRVVRYVERNALRANLVELAEQWRWSSLWRRNANANDELGLLNKAILSDWPIDRPADWLALVNQPQTEAELTALRRCVKRGCPYGDSDWVKTTAKQLGLNSTLRKLGRPRATKITGQS
jgi:putative transposase